MKNKYLKIRGVFLIIGLLTSTISNAQVGIGTVLPDASAMLDVQSTSKGILIPRMTSAQRTAISAVTGLLVFDTDTQSFWFYKTIWTELADGTPDKIINAEGDTRVEVEKSPDEDKIRFTTKASERMSIDGTGNTRIGDIANGHDTKIEPDGTVMFEGNATVWDDLRVSMDNGSSSASLGYSPGESSGGQIWYFRNAAGLETLSFQAQLPHTYKEGTNIYPHLHWTPNATRSGNVEWNFDYTWANYDSVNPIAFPTTATSTIVATGPFTIRTHLITSLTPGIEGGTGLDGTGKKVSSVLMCRLWRNSGNSQDTYNDDAGLISFDFHFQIDTVGSRVPFSK